ncbi:hypothetical protein V8C40DRAFT_159592 [Trichoderma camerunense]
MGSLLCILLLLLMQPATRFSFLFFSKSIRSLMNERYPASCYSTSSKLINLNTAIPTSKPPTINQTYTTTDTKSQITAAAMCVHFRSWNRCSSCFLTFNRRCNRVPCWNGSLSRWRIHRHGLSCRSGCYERADDEVYTHLSCESCNIEAEAANCAEGGKADVMEARNAGVLRGMMGNRATMKRRADISGVFMRLWSFREVLRGRGNGKRGKRHLRMRIRML